MRSQHSVSFPASLALVMLFSSCAPGVRTGAFLHYSDADLSGGESERAAYGANPIPIVVPCHRVIAANHALGGFMGAKGEGFELAIKRWLLEHEGAL